MSLWGYQQPRSTISLPSTIAVLSLIIGPLALVDAKKKEKQPPKMPRNFDYIDESNDYYEALGRDSRSGVVVAFLDEKSNTYYDEKKIFNDAAVTLRKCLPRERIRILRVRKDAVSADIHNTFHDVHKKSTLAHKTPGHDTINSEDGSKINGFLRPRQTYMEVPFVALFGIEQGIPEPLTIHARNNRLVASKTGLGTSELRGSWNLAALEAWAKSACDVYATHADPMDGRRLKQEL